MRRRKGRTGEERRGKGEVRQEEEARGRGRSGAEGEPREDGPGVGPAGVRRAGNAF